MCIMGQLPVLGPAGIAGMHLIVCKPTMHIAHTPIIANNWGNFSFLSPGPVKSLFLF